MKYRESLQWEITKPVTVHTENGEVDAQPGDVMILDLDNGTLTVYEVRQAKAAAQ